jgi:hypothetical protein
MNRETDKSGDNESGRPNGPPANPEARPASPQGDQPDPRHQFIEELKRGLEKTRLPADLRQQILAELPPPEERERLLQELQQNGGMSFEQLMESLGLEAHPQP